MNIDSLGVMNSLFKLRLKDEVFDTAVEESTHTDRKGKFILATPKKKVIFIDHDKKHEIIIKNRSKLPQNIEVGDRLICNTLINFIPPNEVNTLHDIVKKHYYTPHTPLRAKNLEELKDAIALELTNQQDTTLYYHNFKSSVDAIFWLFDKRKIKLDYTESYGGEKQYHYPHPTREGVDTIVNVFSRNNCRIFLTNSGHHHLNLWAYTHMNNIYDYIRKGREIYDRMWVCDELNGKLTVDELKILENKTDLHDQLLTTELYSTLQNQVRLELMSARRNEEMEIAMRKVSDNITKEYKKKGKAIRGGINFTKDQISYSGYTIKGERVEEYVIRNNILYGNNLDFNTIFEGYIDYIIGHEIENGYGLRKETHYLKLTTIQEMWLNKIHLVAEKRGKNLYLNNRKVRTDEITELMKSAIEYETQKEYDEYLIETSKISLRVNKAIRHGFNFTLNVNSTDDNDLLKAKYTTHLSIPLVREKNKNYAVINQQKYRVADIQTLFDVAKDVQVGYAYNESHLQRTITFLKRALPEMTYKDISDFITAGEKEYKTKVKRSLEFIQHAVKITKAKRVEDGWIVKGESGQKYYVGEDKKVYTAKKNKPDKYLCIIDLGTEQSEAGHNDAIAKRILALKHDSTVASDIWRNGDHMDKHWRNLQ